MRFCEFSFFKEVKLLFYLSWELGAKIKQVPLYQYWVRCQVKILPWGYMGTFWSTDGVQLTAGEFPTNSGIFAIYLQIPNTLRACFWKLTFRKNRETGVEENKNTTIRPVFEQQIQTKQASRTQRHGARRKSQLRQPQLLQLSRFLFLFFIFYFCFPKTETIMCIYFECLTKNQLLIIETGYVVLESFASDEEIEAMRKQMDHLLDGFDCSTSSVFSTTNQVFFFFNSRVWFI